MGDTLKTAWAVPYWVKGWKEEKEKGEEEGPRKKQRILVDWDVREAGNC